jgi:hypothetical protein
LTRNRNNLSWYGTLTTFCSYQLQRDYPSTSFSSLGNIFLCEGAHSNVLKIRAAKRKGQTNFVTVFRTALASHFGDKQVGLGGTFLITQGKFKSHIMPGFPPKDAPGDGSWLTFYETMAPVTCLSVIVSKDVHGDDLRLEHTHFWSHDGTTGTKTRLVRT